MDESQFPGQRVMALSKFHTATGEFTIQNSLLKILSYMSTAVSFTFSQINHPSPWMPFTKSFPSLKWNQAVLLR